MTTPLWFYHLQRRRLGEALPPLLEKCLERGWRALVCGTIPERLEELDAHLWTYRDDSFLPHGIEGRDPAEAQPVLLSARNAPVNGAKALFLIDGAAFGDLAPFERACVLFDGNDEASLGHARQQWKEAKAAGFEAVYWKENSDGRWEKQG
jgi:DNA polymerase-3 subunit chi